MTYVHTTPWALYNEIDGYAADWLENLIAIGAIAPGVVDRRSIEDLCADDLRGFRQVHFFAGIGVWSYGLRRAGVPDDLALWTGSCPCQPFSAAGKGSGVDDERHLWPAFFHLIGECRPHRLFGEQVASKDGLGWLDLVLSDMEAAGYAIGAVDTCSAGHGAPHIRQRLRFAAYDLRSAASGLADETRRRLGKLGDALGTGQGGYADCSRNAFGGVADTDGRDPGTERQQRRGEQRQFQEDHRVVRLADDGGPRLEGCHSRSVGQQCTSAQRNCSGELDWMADLHSDGLAERRGSVPSTWHDGFVGNGATELVGNAERLDTGWDTGTSAGPESGPKLRPVGNDTGSSGSVGRPGPTNGFWGAADWLFCRDGQWRPAQPSHVEMVDGIAASLGRSGPFEKGESETRLQALLETFGEEAVREQAGGSWSISEEVVLRPDLYGGLDGRAHQSSESQEQPPTIGKNLDFSMRSVPAIGGEVPCPSHRREPAEQHPVELTDVVRLLPQSLALAKLYGQRAAAEKLSVLQCSIDKEGALLHPPRSGEAAWASIGEDAKNRIRMGFDVGAWRRVVSFPLVDGDDFKLGSGGPFEGKSRQGMLKGYGNAIDAEATTDFLEACFEWERTHALADAFADVL